MSALVTCEQKAQGDHGRTIDGRHNWTHHQINCLDNKNKAKQNKHTKKERHDFNIFKSLVHSDGLDDDAANVFNAKARSHASHSCLFDSLSAVGCAGLICSTFDNSICTEVSMRSALPNKTSAGICSCDDRWCREELHDRVLDTHSAVPC